MLPSLDAVRSCKGATGKDEQSFPKLIEWVSPRSTLDWKSPVIYPPAVKCQSCLNFDIPPPIPQEKGLLLRAGRKERASLLGRRQAVDPLPRPERLFTAEPRHLEGRSH